MSKKYDIVTIISSLILMAALVVSTIFWGDQFIAGLGTAKNWVIYKLGWVFILIVAAITFYVLWLALSKYGSIRMGRCKPQFGWFGYASMIFCAAMGSCMIFWPSVEWAEYICWTDVWPFGWGAGKWQITPWLTAFSTGASPPGPFTLRASSPSATATM